MGKGVLKICSKCTEAQVLQKCDISKITLLQSNFIKITIRQWVLKLLWMNVTFSEVAG